MVVSVENGVQREEFSLVVFRGTGTVRVDIIDIRGSKPRFFDSPVNRKHLPLSVGTGSGDMVRVRAYARAENFAVNLGTARLCVLIALDNQHTRALTERDTVAVVERRARVLVKRVKRVKSRKSKRGKAVRAARRKSVRLTRANEVASV